MSSPTRQMLNRKLPPLPSSKSPFANKPNNSNASTAGIYSNEKRSIEKTNKDLAATLSDGPFRPALVNASSEKSTAKDSSKQCEYKLYVYSIRVNYEYLMVSRRER